MVKDADESFQNKQYNLARHLYNELVKIDPDNSDYLDRRGYCYEVSGSTSKALVDYNNAIINAPDEHYYYSNRARLFMKQKKFQKAYEDLNKAVELTNSMNAKYINNRGMASIGMGDTAKACLDFKLASQMNFEISLQNLSKFCK